MCYEMTDDTDKVACLKLIFICIRRNKSNMQTNNRNVRSQNRLSRKMLNKGGPHKRETN
jgi:hypothetical protein